MKILIIDTPGFHPVSSARALGRALHQLGHGVIVHPIACRRDGWFRRAFLKREARMIVQTHEPDVVHVISPDPEVAEAFAGRGAAVVHSTYLEPSRVDWVVAPSQAALDRLAPRLAAGERHAGVLPYPVEIPDETPSRGSFVLAAIAPDDAEARGWVEEAAASLPQIPVREEGDPAEAQFVISMTSQDDVWPRGVAEAMAAGRPVVAGWKGAVAEFVLEGVTGFLSAPGDVRSLATHMTYLWDQPEEALRLGLAGREEARQHFGGESNARTLVRWYLRAGFSKLAV